MGGSVDGLGFEFFCEKVEHTVSITLTIGKYVILQHHHLGVSHHRINSAQLERKTTT